MNNIYLVLSRLILLPLVGLMIVVAGCTNENQEGSGVTEAEPTAAATPAADYEIVNIRGNVYRAGVLGAGGHATAFLLTSDGVILADPINHAFAEWLKAELLAQFNAQVKYVIYSHHHGDHASGGSVFADTATIVGHQNVRSALQNLPTNYARLDRNMGNGNGNGLLDRDEATGGVLRSFDAVDTNGDDSLSADEVNATVQPVDIVYSDKLTVTLGGSTVEVHHTPPAHSHDMSVVFFPEERTVFAVDFLQPRRIPGGLGGFLADSPVDDYETAIGVVQALDFDTILQGHSTYVGTKSDVDEFLTLLRVTEAEVTAAIENGLSLEETLESVMLPDYTDWLLYEQRRPALVSDMYLFLTKNS